MLYVFVLFVVAKPIKCVINNLQMIQIHYASQIGSPYGLWNCNVPRFIGLFWCHVNCLLAYLTPLLSCLFT